MIKVQNLQKKYFTEGIETLALENITFDIEAGEFVAVMGPSGCGKSTLLNILGMVDVGTRGNYFFKGEDISGLTENKRAIKRRGKIGFVFQRFNLIDDLTVYENIELPLIYQNVGRQERKDMVFEMMERMNISHRKNHFPIQLSGGQQQRVAVARAVITSPELILADEPTGNLDSINGEEVMSILKDLNTTGTTVVIVTHSPNYADYADRIIHLFDGHVVAQNAREARGD